MIMHGILNAKLRISQLSHIIPVYNMLIDHMEDMGFWG